MQSKLIEEGRRIATICNACRYCEGFCAVFPAIEMRQTFAEADMNYLANLCHNCTECLRACPYAPSHPFDVNVTLTMAKIRLRCYEEYCWPRPLGAAFRSYSVATALIVVVVLMGIFLVTAGIVEGDARVGLRRHADFYAVVPHEVMAGVFLAVSALAVTAMGIAVARFVKDTWASYGAARWRGIESGLRDALTLKYLHGSGEECASDGNSPVPWRRLFHHLTFYGFALCFASTAVAATYHLVLHRSAPYPVFSLPVMLGTAGGIGLVVGPSGLWAMRARRDRAAADPEQRGLDQGFVLLLVLTSATGLALLAFRGSTAMPTLLIAHLSVVLALLVSLPYGKFMHGLYRTAALIQYAWESRAT